MREIIVLFLVEIPDRMQNLTSLREQGDRTGFARLLHQIKGAGGGYGYPLISQAALQVSRCLEASGDSWLDTCDTHFNFLLNVLRRAHAGLPDLQE